MRELTELVRTNAAQSLWRVYFHRSSVFEHEPNKNEITQQLLGEFFDLINMKPLVDLKLDNFKNITSMFHDENESQSKLSDLCTNNTRVRNRDRVNNLTSLMFLQAKLR